MTDQFKITINYFRLKKYLVEQLHYSDHAAVSAISNIRQMTPDIRGAFLTWFTTGVQPEGDFHGINFANLITYRNMNPVAAFLAVDWYVKEPEVAYSVLAMPLKDKEAEILIPNDAADTPVNENTDDISM